MLNSASDYQYVDTSNLSRYIDGNILPVRNQNGTGRATCKYEDYLFLLEAYNERMYANQIGTNNISAASRIVTASNINETRFSSTSFSWGTFINKNSGIPSDIVETQYIDDTLSGTSLSLYKPYTQSPSYRFLDSLCKRFDDVHNMSKAKCSYSNIYTQVLFSSGSFFYMTYYDNGWPPHEDGSGSNINNTFYSYHASKTSSYSMERFLTVTYNENEPALQNYMNAKSAKLLIQITYYDSTNYRYFVAPIDCTVSNGGISVPSHWWVDVGKKIAQKVGKQYYESAPNVFDENQNMSLTMHSGAFIIDFDFPADYT